MKKRLFSIFVLISILISVMPVHAEELGDNVFVNGDFEDGTLSGWIQEMRAQYTPSAVVMEEDDGNYYVRCVADKLQGHNRLYQNNRILQKGQLYKLSMDIWGIKADESIDEISYITAVRVREDNGSGTNYSPTVTYTDAGKQAYETYLMVSKTGPCTIAVFASMTLTNCSYLCFDNVKIEPVTGIDTYDFENESLDYKDTGYRLWEATENCVADIVEGGFNSNKALSVVPNGEGIFRHYVSFKADSNYYISSMAKAPEGSEIKLFSVPPEGEAKELASAVGTGDWQEIYAFSDDENSADGYLYIQATTEGDEKTEYLLDNLKVTSSYSYTVSPTFSGELFSIGVEGECSEKDIYTVTLENESGEVLYTALYNDGTGKYEFSVSELPIGYYTVKAEVGGYSLTEEVFYYNTEILDALKKLNQADVDEISTCFSGDGQKLGLDTACYTELTDESIITSFNTVIAGLDLTVREENISTDIPEKISVLKDAYNKYIVPVYIADCKESTKLEKFAGEKSADDFMADDKYYKTLAEKNGFYGYLMKVRDYIEQNPVTDEDYLENLYNKSMVIYMINEGDYRNIPDILGHYSEYVSVSLDKYNKLNTPSKKALALSRLSDKNIINPSVIEDELNKICSELAYTGGGGGGGGSSSGGGGGKVVSGSGGNYSYSAPVVSDKSTADDEDEKSENAGEDKPSDVITTDFKDLETAEWAKEAISKLEELGVVNGKSETEFAPDDNVTREEAIKMIVLAFDVPLTGATAAFTDVKPDSWYYPYVAAARTAGITTGTGDHKFGTGLSIKRQDIAQMIYSLYLDKTENPLKDAEQTFADYESIDYYARQAVSTLASLGVINGRGNGCFAPHDTVTRAEAAKMIYGAMSIIK